MIELKNIFVPKDLYYHFLEKFNRTEWENLNVDEMKEYIDKHIPEYVLKETEGGYRTHEAYIVLSFIDNTNAQFKLKDLNPVQFHVTYVLAIEQLKLAIMSNDDMFIHLELEEFNKKYKTTKL